MTDLKAKFTQLEWRQYGGRVRHARIMHDGFRTDVSACGQRCSLWEHIGPGEQPPFYRPACSACIQKIAKEETP